MPYIISQIAGGIVFVLVFLSMQTKNITKVMLTQIGCNALGMLSYVLLVGFSACGICFVATVQSTIFFFLRKYDKENPIWLTPVIFAAYILCSVLTYQGPLDLIPMLAALLCALGLTQKNPTNYRIIMLLNGATWVVYDVFIAAYTMLATHGFTVASALLGLIRLDILKKKSE